MKHHEYLIRIPPTESIGTTYNPRSMHSRCIDLFKQVGLCYSDYTFHHGDNDNNDFWVIDCDGPALTVLMLSGASIEKDITQEHMKQGLSKLSIEETEALGLSQLFESLYDSPPNPYPRFFTSGV